MESRPPYINLRRFGLTAGLLLILYSFLRGTIEDSLSLTLLGISIPISKALLDICLPIFSTYAVGRFSFYELYLSTPAFQVRKELKGGAIPIWFWAGKGKDVTIFDFITKAQSYFPSVPIEEINIFFKNDQSPEQLTSGANPANRLGFKIVIPPLKLKTRLLILVEEVDFWVPVWINGIAIFSWVLALRT